MAPGDTITVSFTVLLDATEMGGTTPNTVTAGGTSPSGTTLTIDGTDEANAATTDGTAGSNVTPPSDAGTIGLVKSSTLNDGGDGSVDVGDTIEYTYVVTNTSATVNVFNVWVSEPNDATNDFTGTGTAPVPNHDGISGADLDLSLIHI